MNETTAHIELLLEGVAMSEYSRTMMAIAGDRVDFIGITLNLPHMDGAPARAFAIETDP